MLFKARNTSIEWALMRLFPSIKGWFCTSPKASLAAFACNVSYRSLLSNVWNGASRAASKRFSSLIPSKPPATSISFFVHL